MNEFYYPKTYSQEESEYAQQKITKLYAKDQPITDEGLNELSIIYEEYIELKRKGVDPDIPHMSYAESREEEQEENHEYNIECVEQEINSSRRTFLKGLAGTIIGGSIAGYSFYNAGNLDREIDEQVDAKIPPISDEEKQLAQKTIDKYEQKMREAVINGQRPLNETEAKEFVDAYTSKKNDRLRLDLNTKLHSTYGLRPTLNFFGILGGSGSTLFTFAFTAAGLTNLLNWKKERIKLNNPAR